MSRIKFSCDWMSAGLDEPEFRDTTAQLAIYVDDVSLTQSEDIWSKTVRHSVLVSAYPLAMWFASSWWRLSYEPLPKQRAVPSVDWRMAHELGAANHGFVWPKVVFATDGEAMQVWAAPSKAATKQSVRYLNGLSAPITIAMPEFHREVEKFISAVIARLEAMGHGDSQLSNLWSLIQEDRSDASASHNRRIEAQLGYEPEDCPSFLMEKALSLESLMGVSALSELAPVYGQIDGGATLGDLSEISKLTGLNGKPEVDLANAEPIQSGSAPWRRGVDAARRVRTYIGNERDPIDDRSLYALLGLNVGAVENWMPQSRQKVAIAVPTSDGLNYIPRKKHPLARRFEFARFLGDYVASKSESNRNWLASTDLSTSRQKTQRAFAAEFLCPIDSLVEFLDEDFSEAAIEDASDRFGVSEQTVESLLANNGYIGSRYANNEMPYRLAA